MNDGWHETEVRVRYAETDQMGIVHHSNYLIWFEAGRSEYCRSRGFSYKEMEDEGDMLMVVAESYVRYKSPAFYEDILTIRTRVGEMRSRSLRFIYEIFRASDETMIAEGETMHLVTNKEKKVQILPDFYRERLIDDPHNSFPPNQAPS
jgi:acyl-CoA thioester hydrolase